MKKIISVVLCLALSFSLTAPVFATDTGEIQGPIHEILYGEDELARAATFPSANSYYNLGAGNYYIATIPDLAPTKTTFTRYYFSTPTESMYLKLNFEHSGFSSDLHRMITVELWHVLTPGTEGTLHDSRTIAYSSTPDTWNLSFRGLEKNDFYYVRFKNISSTNVGDGKTISGKCTISDTSIS